MNQDTGATYCDEEIDEAKERGENLTELPHKPSPDCKKCKGKGVRKSWGTQYQYGTCPKCYPGRKDNAVDFNTFLSRQKRGGE